MTLDSVLVIATVLVLVAAPAIAQWLVSRERRRETPHVIRQLPLPGPNDELWKRWEDGDR
jgi:hypothetical protein